MDKVGAHSLHHAVLLVERYGAVTPYHWSYHRGRFLPGVVNWHNRNRPVIACRPEKEFTERLKLIDATVSAFREIWLRGGPVRIPKAYEPKGGGTYLSIAAAPPDFAPTARKLRKLYPSMKIRSRSWLQSSADRIIGADHAGTASGLIEAPAESPTKRSWYRLEGNGEIATLITCYDARPPEIRCQHRFYRDGRMYYFEHSLELLGRSAEMEQRLFELFASFETG